MVERRGVRVERVGCVPEIVPSAELSAQFVVQASPHFSEPAPAQVAAEAVFVPVLIDGFQEIAVPDVLLATAACQQRRGNLEDFIHRLPEGRKEPLEKENGSESIRMRRRRKNKMQDWSSWNRDYIFICFSQRSECFILLTSVHSSFALKKINTLKCKELIRASQNLPTKF